MQFTRYVYAKSKGANLMMEHNKSGELLGYGTDMVRVVSVSPAERVGNGKKMHRVVLERPSK